MTGPSRPTTLTLPLPFRRRRRFFLVGGSKLSVGLSLGTGLRRLVANLPIWTGGLGSCWVFWLTSSCFLSSSNLVSWASTFGLAGVGFLASPGAANAPI